MEIDDDEDDDIEMTMTTMEQFDHRLNQMMDKIINKQWQKHCKLHCNGREGCPYIYFVLYLFVDKFFGCLIILQCYINL